MKTIATVLATTIALGALASMGLAQQAGPTGGVQSAAAQAKPKKEGKKARLAKLDTEEKKAYKAVSGAIKLAEHALPIYDGHRLLAIDLMKTARTGLVVGANNETPSAKKGKKANKSAAAEGHDKTKYTPAQVAASQRELQQAVEILNKAMQDLATKTDSANTEAAANLRKAQDELKAAIALHGTA